MELQDLDSISLQNETETLLEALDEDVREYRTIGNFSPEVRDEISRSFLPDRISDTLNIESIRVNPRITRAILEGLAIAQADKYNEREVLNVIEANDFVEQYAKSEMLLSADLVREVNRRILTGAAGQGGAFRDHDVQITGSEFRPPPWAAVADLVERACTIFNSASSVHPVTRACWLHLAISEIHPFEDGNGRVARLLQDLSLMRDQLLPVGIPVSRREEYYDSLAEADAGEWDSVVTLVTNSLITAIGRARQIASAPKRRRERIGQILKAARNKRTQRDYTHYEVWKRQVAIVCDELHRWFYELAEESPELHARFRFYDPIEFEKWKDIRQRGHVQSSWLMSIAIHPEGQVRQWYCLYAKRHSRRDVLETEAVPDDAVAMFLTSDDESGRADFTRYSDRYIRLRELIYVDGQLIAFRDPEAGASDRMALPEEVTFDEGPRTKWRASTRGDLGGVVEELLQDCLLKAGLI